MSKICSAFDERSDRGCEARHTFYAQDAAAASPAKGLEVELNGLAPSQKGCMMTFVALNNLAAPINKISFELAFFNDKNAVDRDHRVWTSAICRKARSACASSTCRTSSARA